jgi:hypothetical protein
MEKVSGVNGLDMPLGALAHQLAVAIEFVGFAVMTGQDTHHGLALIAQRINGMAQGDVFRPWGTDGTILSEGAADNAPTLSNQG